MNSVQDEPSALTPKSAGGSPRRSVDKDHLQQQAGILSLVSEQIALRTDGDPLVFWTLHPTNPYLVDLTEFAEGRVLKAGKAQVIYGARRALIEQMAPAFQARYSMAAPRTVDTVKAGLRKWWCLFVVIEAEERAALPPAKICKQLTSVLDLGALHGSRAAQSGMTRNDFHSFVVLADITRLALGERRPLYWVSPAKPGRPLAVVLPPEDIKALYHGIKEDWHIALDRWALADGLQAGPTRGGFLAGQSPGAIELRNDYERSAAGDHNDQATRARQRLDRQCEQERRIIDGVRLWQAAATRLGHADLLRQDFLDTSGSQAYPDKALNISEAAPALFPTGTDIRSAFYLCVAVGGLNTSVLTRLRLELPAGMVLPEHLVGPVADVDERREWVLKHCPFLVQSPVDGEYYIEGWKDRAKSWISRTYKWKQHLTPGPVLVELIIRTWPLRLALARRLDTAMAALGKAARAEAPTELLNELRQRVHELTDAVQSAWIYRGRRGISWLSDEDCHALQPSQTYIQAVTERLNDRRRLKGQPDIGLMEPRRFRDAYAAWVLDYSGGEVLAVMVALDHRQAATTDGYLENTAVRARVARKYRFFSHALFGSLSAGVLDPTLMALEARFAVKDQSERSRMAVRLVDYRAAVKSRYGVGCRDPQHPSSLADPAFVADGEKTCTTHRCTLCPRNAIITPDAYPGLMLRQAELEFMEEHMPVASFTLSSFDAELQNARAALLPLATTDPERLAATVAAYTLELREGKRRLPGFSIKPT